MHAPKRWIAGLLAALFAAFGLRDGDRIVVPEGADPISADQILANVELGRELTVARRHGRVWVDLILPDPAASPEAAPEDP
jgi:hypothetical protein